MNLKRIKTCWIVVVLAITHSLSAQFVAGWSAGYMPAYELNRVIYEYNAVNRLGLTKEMPAAHLFQGPTAGYRRTFSDGYAECLFSRKEVKVSSEFDSAGVPMKRQLKLYSNSFNWGFAYGKSGWHAGLSFDFGFCKGKGKRGMQEGFKDLSSVWLVSPMAFLRIFNRMLPDANTVWIERDIGNFAAIRFYAQMFWLRTDLNSEKSGRALDEWMLGTGINWFQPIVERFNNYGVTLTLKFGK